MANIADLNKQIDTLQKRKAVLLGQQAQLDTQIAAIRTQKANIEKTNPSQMENEILEDGEPATPATPSSQPSSPDGAINDTTLGNYKYYPKIGVPIQKDYKSKKYKYGNKDIKAAQNFLKKKFESL